MKLTGVLAQVFMKWWDKTFLKRLEQQHIETFMYKRYVDDINIVVKSLSADTTYNDGRIVTMQNHDNNRTEPKDKHTMETLQQIANDIHPSIQLEIDVPSNHKDGKMPILDLKVWLEEDMSNQRHLIMHEFYAKEVSSESVVPANSALPWSIKRAVMTQELLRVFLNCSTSLPWQRITEHASNTTLKMQYSGYDKAFRHQVVKSALSAYHTLLEKDRNGERPLHRPREWKKRERERKKRSKAQEWYGKGNYDSVLFIPATPNGELKKTIQQEINKSTLRIKVVEKNGVSITSLLQKSNPMKERNCRREDCFVCTSKGKGDCSRNNIVYEIKCNNCNSKYCGETARNAYTRGKEHMKLLHEKEQNSPLWSHCLKEHNGHIQQFTMNVVRTFHRDSMMRQITEAIHIRKIPERKSMNAKEEWNTVYLPHARTEKD